MLDIITIVEQIGCSDADMENSFGKKWISSLELKIPSLRRRNFYSTFLITISSVFDDLSQLSTPYWDLLVTQQYSSSPSSCLKNLVIRRSGSRITMLSDSVSISENQISTGDSKSESKPKHVKFKSKIVHKINLSATLQDDGSIIMEENIVYDNGTVMSNATISK